MNGGVHPLIRFSSLSAKSTVAISLTLMLYGCIRWLANLTEEEFEEYIVYVLNTPAFLGLYVLLIGLFISFMIYSAGIYLQNRAFQSEETTDKPEKNFGF